MKLIIDVTDSKIIKNVVIDMGTHMHKMHVDDMHGFTIIVNADGISYRHESADQKERMEGLTAYERQKLMQEDVPPGTPCPLCGEPRQYPLSHHCKNKPEDKSGCKGGGSKFSPQESADIILQYAMNIRDHFGMNREEWGLLTDEGRLSLAKEYDTYIKGKGEK